MTDDNKVGDPDRRGEFSVISRIGASGYRTELESGRHRYLADEPVEMHGTDLGPSPYDYLLASLGSCTAITMRMYADRKKWPLEGVTIRLRHDRIHAIDCASCDSRDGQISRIYREIEVRGGKLTLEQRERLIEIADKCPVHRTLSHEISIVTSAGG
ncbi:MAG: OsmC family protein [Phycisphaerales bacterium]